MGARTHESGGCCAARGFWGKSLWTRAMSRMSGLRNDMNKRTFYKEQKINNRSFDFLSKQNIIVPLILDINGGHII